MGLIDITGTANEELSTGGIDEEGTGQEDCERNGIG